MSLKNQIMIWILFLLCSVAYSTPVVRMGYDVNPGNNIDCLGLVYDTGEDKYKCACRQGITDNYCFIYVDEGRDLLYNGVRVGFFVKGNTGVYNGKAYLLAGADDEARSYTSDWSEANDGVARFYSEYEWHDKSYHSSVSVGLYCAKCNFYGTCSNNWDTDPCTCVEDAWGNNAMGEHCEFSSKCNYHATYGWSIPDQQKKVHYGICEGDGDFSSIEGCPNGYSGSKCEYCDYCNGRGTCTPTTQNNNVPIDNDVCDCKKNKRCYGRSCTYVYGGQTCSYTAGIVMRNEQCYAGVVEFNRCKCDTGWSGLLCDTQKKCPVGEWETCADSGELFRCTAGGFVNSVSGDIFSSDPGVPADQCNGHGTCKNTHKRRPWDYSWKWVREVKDCDCEDGWYGSRCELNYSPLCSNHGYLENGSCKCLEGFSGPTCQFCNHCNDVGECGDNGPTDTDGVCVCPAGYTGTYCGCKNDQCGASGSCNLDGSCGCPLGSYMSDCSGSPFNSDTAATCKGACSDSSIKTEEACTGTNIWHKTSYCSDDEYKNESACIFPNNNVWNSIQEICKNGNEVIDVNTVEDCEINNIWTPVCEKSKCNVGFSGDSCNICDNCQTCEGEYIEYTGTFLEEKDYVIRMKEKPGTLFYRNYNLAPAQAVQIPDTGSVDGCYDACMNKAKHLDTRQSIDNTDDLDRDGYERDIFFADRRDWGENWETIDSLWINPSDIPSNCPRTVECPDTETPTTEISSTDVDNYYLGEYPWYKYDIHGTFEYTGTRLWKKRESFYEDVQTMENIDGSYQTVRISEGVKPPKIYLHMKDFWDTYDTEDVTHFEYETGKCICYTASEGELGTMKSITYDPRISIWDKRQTSTITESSEIIKVNGTKSYFIHRDEIYCVPCPEGEYALDYVNKEGRHCCPENFGGDDCGTELVCNSDPCPEGSQCIDSIRQNAFTGPIAPGSYLCSCIEGKTGDDCDIDCCIRGATIGHSDKNGVTHGDCNYGPGGCTCDYGYIGYHCECSDDMCDGGYCNPEIEAEGFDGPMCKCHPGSEWYVDKCVETNNCIGETCSGHGSCEDVRNDYECKCSLGYVGKDCEISTNWNFGNTTCPKDEYLIEGRCIDCPAGTYSLAGDTICRVKLTDDNIHDAVSASPDDYYIANRTQVCIKGSEQKVGIAPNPVDCFAACGNSYQSIKVTGLCYCIDEADMASDECQTVLGSHDQTINGVYYSISTQTAPRPGLSGIYMYTKKFYSLYGDITTFDTSEVTNMDGLFMNKAVPDISEWNIGKVTSMRNTFAGSTGSFAKWTIASSVDTTNIYAGSDMQLEFEERTSGSCLDTKESFVRPVVTKEECLLAQYDASVTFTEKVTVHPLMANAGRRGCRYAVAADSHQFDFAALVENDLRSCDNGGTCCTADVPCLCAKIRQGEYVKESSCEGIYEEITTKEQCTIAKRHLDEFIGIYELTSGTCRSGDDYYCKLSEYPPCDGSNAPCRHNGLTCMSGLIIDDTCKVDNEALVAMVRIWALYEEASYWLFGPLKDWDVHYVTDTTDLFRDVQKDPDITLWDMSNVVHADGMFFGSLFNHPIDNKDFSSLQTATKMLPHGYSRRACGKHFLRVENLSLKQAKNKGFEEYGDCLHSNMVGDTTPIKQAVYDWFTAQYTTEAKYGHISEWDVSVVTDMSALFEGKEDIPSLAMWDTGNVKTMKSMFKDTNFNEDIRHWDVRKVTDFSDMFRNNVVFAVDLTFWELHASKHESMFAGNPGNPYYEGITFLIDEIVPAVLTDDNFHDALVDIASAEGTYGPISEWMTHLVTNMSHAFENKQFNKDISKWVVSSVTDMSYMFAGSTFNEDISGWQVVNVENMQGMFMGNRHFNQMIDRWNVSGVEDMSRMFENSVFSRPIGDWVLFGTEPAQIQGPKENPQYCPKKPGLIVVLEGDRTSYSAKRECFDMCSDTYNLKLDDIEGRDRQRGGATVARQGGVGRLGPVYTPYVGGFLIVTDELQPHTCQCATGFDKNTSESCDTGVFDDYVYEYRDMDTTDMFKDNDVFVQPLCGLGWRYRDITSLNLHQRQVALTCDICKPGQHMSECGLCLGEFQFDYCLDSPKGFTLAELEKFDNRLVIEGGTKVNPSACNCEYEEGMKGCLVVNGRKQVRMKEWYVYGEIDFNDVVAERGESMQYFCELGYIDERSVEFTEGFNSVECTDDVLLDRFECGLVGGNWNGQCDRCLKPCLPPELGVKYFSEDRECKVCPEGKTVFENECVTCPDGKFTNEDYAYCGKCPMGTFGTDGECNSCPSGSVSTYEGALACTVCDVDTFSIGTSCQACFEGKRSNAGSNSCEDKRHCWHGVTNEGEEIGNYCSEECDTNFKHVDGTCVSACVYGSVLETNGVYTCECDDEWEGDHCNECQLEYDYTYLSHERCEKRTCSSTLVTDCFCTDKIVRDTEACYYDRVVVKCIDTNTECMCEMSDGGLEWTPVGTICKNGVIIEPCGLFDNKHNVPLQPCSDAGYDCEFGMKDAFCTNAFECTSAHFRPGESCCYRGDCSQVECDADRLYNRGGSYDIADECCVKRETCKEGTNRDPSLACGLSGRNTLDSTTQERALSTFKTLQEYELLCCTSKKYKIHPFNVCGRFFGERELIESECDDYEIPNGLGYKEPQFLNGQCVMKRELDVGNVTSVICIQVL